MTGEYPTIEIEGLAEPLEPYAYEEDLEEDALVVTARVRTSRELGAALRELWSRTRRANEYVNVTRVGRDTEPQPMRFGQPFWSQHADQEKHEVVLVDRAYDKEGPRQRGWPTNPEDEKETNLLIRLSEQMDALLSTLAGSGALTDEGLTRIRSLSDERLVERRLDLKRVDDIDDWK